MASAVYPENLMADAIHKTTMEYRPSEDPNTLGDEWLLLGRKAPARMPSEDEVRVIRDVPQQYWIIDKGTLREMTQAERTAKAEADAIAKAAAEDAAANTFAVDPQAAVIALAKLLVAKDVATKAEIKAAMLTEVRK